ncbi:MAG: PsiF family protein [Proteobacteria bacterium]|nr:PsiF family protein [Pseudomonadota bacterium]
MTKMLTIAAVFAALASGTVFADEKKAPTAQQSKMALCNKDAGAKQLKGDARKQFMSECLKAKPAGHAPQQNKMASCNKDAGAKNLKGDERKAFMSNCLKR